MTDTDENANPQHATPTATSRTRTVRTVAIAAVAAVVASAVLGLAALTRSPSLGDVAAAAQPPAGGEAFLPHAGDDDLLDDDAFGEDASGDDEFGEELPEETEVAIYPVEDGRLGEPALPPVDGEHRAAQDDRDTHEDVWELLAALTPEPWESLISSFVILTDGPDGMLAAVEPDWEDPSRWTVAVDVADADDTDELRHTLIHELAHIVTLNEDQIDHDAAPAVTEDESYETAGERCRSGVAVPEGCARVGSWFAEFHDRFWADIDDELAEVEAIEDDEDYYEALDRFYERYQDRFVSDYAATNPGEDIAESFTAWVLDTDVEDGSMAAEKLEFFEAYPELVELRDHIRDAG